VCFSISSNSTPSRTDGGRLLSAVPLLSPHSRENRLTWRWCGAPCIRTYLTESWLRPKVNASDLASSVLPTPVGPEKIKLAMGRLGLLIGRDESRNLDGLFLTNQPVEVSSIFKASVTQFCQFVHCTPVRKQQCGQCLTRSPQVHLIAALQSVFAWSKSALIPISRSFRLGQTPASGRRRCRWT